MADIQSKEFELIGADISRPNRGVVSTKDFTDPQALYEELIRYINRYHPSDDISMIEKGRSGNGQGDHHRRTFA